MKKLLILLLAALLLTGCTPVTAIEEEELNERAERYVYAAKWLGSLVEYDLQTRTAAYICSDEACMHDQSCIYSDINRYAVDDKHEYVFYERAFSEMQGPTVYCYHTETKESVFVMEYDRISDFGFVGNFVYFSAETQEAEGAAWGIYRYQTQTQSLE